MTREEAIQRLKTTDACDSELCEALDMAIKALEQQPTDAVDRQVVLEQTYLWSKDEFLRVTNPFDYLRKRINSLPSVTPQPCGDCISREETLKALMDEWTEYDSELIGWLFEKIDKLPSVTAQPKVGHWEWNQYDANPKIGNFHCSLCHSIGRTYFDYCPYCGAKMSEIPTGAEGSDKE